MKILTIIPDFGRRGTQRVGQSFSLSFRKFGHDVAVFPILPAGPRRATFADAGVHIFDAIPDIDAGLRQAVEYAPDVVHIHRPGLTIPIETFVLKTLRPVSKCIVETNIFARADPAVLDIVDVSFQLTRCGLYRWNKLAVPRARGRGIYVPNPVDFTDFHRTDAAAIAAYRRDVLGIDDPNAFVFGRIGKSDPRLLSSTFAQIVAREPRARLATIGGDDLLAVIERLAPEVRSRVIVLPGTDSDVELSRFYSAVDALLHWSPNGESFGMVLAEAIACGTPVVMPLQPHRDIGGVEVIGHGEGGRIAGSSRSLADVACRLMHERSSMDQPLIAARQRLVREYDADAVARRAIAAMEVAIDARAHGRSIAEALAADGRFETHVSQQWFADMLHHREGPISLPESTMRVVTHNRLLSALLRIIKPPPPMF